MPLEPAVDRSLDLADALDTAGNALRAGERQQPHAAHLGIDLAVAVRAHAATGAVAQILRAVHRPRHAGGAHHALPAHLAVEQQTLDAALDGDERPFQALIADRTK